VGVVGIGPAREIATRDRVATIARSMDLLPRGLAPPSRVEYCASEAERSCGSASLGADGPCRGSAAVCLRNSHRRGDNPLGACCPGSEAEAATLLDTYLSGAVAASESVPLMLSK
jgi:hypothetical protein